MLLLVGWVLMSAAFAERQQLVVDVAADDTLNVRTEPNASATIVGELAPGEVIEQTGVADGIWIEIEFNDGLGWISSRYTYAPATSQILGVGPSETQSTAGNEQRTKSIGNQNGSGQNESDAPQHSSTLPPPADIGTAVAAVLIVLFLAGMVVAAWRASVASVFGVSGWRITDKLRFAEPVANDEISDGKRGYLLSIAKSKFRKLQRGEIEWIISKSLYFVEFCCTCEGHYRGNVSFSTYGVAERTRKTRQYVDLFQEGFAIKRFAEGIPKPLLPKLRRHLKTLSQSENCVPTPVSKNPKDTRRIASIISNLEDKAIGDMKARAKQELDRAAEERGRQPIGDVLRGEPIALRASSASTFGMKFDGIEVSRTAVAWEQPGCVICWTLKNRSRYFLFFPKVDLLIPIHRNALGTSVHAKGSHAAPATDNLDVG